MHSTRKTFLTSMVALVLCLTMFLGTTFAWFTDVVTSSGNIIQAGNLDLDLMKGTKTDSGWDWESTEGKAIFDYDKWEPGYTSTAVLGVQNNGSLSAKWIAKLTLNGTPSILADVITIYTTSLDNYNTTRPDFSDTTVWTKVGTVSELIANGGTLLPGDVIESGDLQPIIIALHMDENAGNEYQDLSLGTNFDITILATQATGESDSFGSDYDANAQWPQLENGYSASTLIDVDDLMLGSLINELTIGSLNGVGATVPADVKIAEGATSLDLTMKMVEADGNLGLGEGDDATSFDVHISGIAADNTKPMIVNLGPVLEAGLTGTELKLYHTENGTPVLMTRVATAADFAIHNQYTYDPTTGNVSIYVATFSVFSAVETSADVWDGESAATGFASGTGSENDPYIIDTAAQLIYFRNQVDAGVNYAGQFVKLNKDIDLNNKLFNPIGGGWAYNGGKTFNGTFDGDNHTIYNIYVNGWELDATGDQHSSTSKGAGLFSSVHNATIKNLAISGANMRVETTSIGIVAGCAQGKCTFENIVVTNAILGNYQMRNGGIVGDIYVIASDKVESEYSHTFTNIVVDSSVKLVSMWGDFDTGNGGVIGGKYGSAKVLMKDVIVACELDVFSDVTAAYQWYAYRRCGMLVGYTGQNSPKQATNAAADFLTCVNVNVFYGDWVNYNYYEFNDQDSEKGCKYPWVRAEAGQYNAAFSNPRYGVPTYNGVKVSEMDADILNDTKTGYAAITFNQLYGGGQGVYGCANHDGVTINHLPFNATTIYFQNSKDWNDLKLQYVYKNGDDTWTTVVDGISLGDPVDTTPLHHIYKVTVPTDAYSFTITDGTNVFLEVECDSLVAGDLYTLDRNDKIQHCAYDGKYNTIYFYNNKNWTNVSLYYWYNDSDGNNWDTLEFPGEKLTATLKDGSHDIYQFVVPAYATAFIISNGTKAKQTEDISITDCAGKIYSVSDETTVNSNNVTVNKVESSTYKEGYKTIYLKNSFKWDAIQAYYNIGASWIQSGTVKLLGYDGTYEYYSVEIPNFAVKFNFSGEKNDGSGNREQIPDQTFSDFTSYNMVAPLYDNAIKINKGTYSNNAKTNDYKQLYFKPSADWYTSNARFAVYAFKDGSGNKWYNLDDKYSGDVYKVWVSTSYNEIILCRMNPKYTTNSWNSDSQSDHVWNQTVDLTIPSDGNNVFTIESVNKIYLKPNSNWKQSNARFAAYFFGNGETWVSMTDSDGDGIYECEIPSGYTKVIFCRMNPGASANNWNNKWNQTGDLTIVEGYCLFTVPDGAWDNSTTTWKYSGTWSKK